MSIDIPTFAIVLAITHAIQIAVFTLQYKVYRTNKSIRWWLWWSIAETVGFVAMLLRGIPSLLSFATLVQNVSIFLGTIFIYVGVMRFLDRKVNRVALTAALLAYTAVFFYFLYIRDDFFMRSGIFALGVAVMSLVTMIALLAHKQPPIFQSAIFNAVVFFIHGCIFLHRGVTYLLGSSFPQVVNSPLFKNIIFIDPLVVSLLWTFGFIVMLNQRLFEESREGKENLEMIFDTIPDAVLVSRLDDGKIAKINSGFTFLTGYSQDEAIGNTVLGIEVWVDPSERQKFLETVANGKAMENSEFAFQRKDKSRFTAIVSAKHIILKGIPHVISVIHDISARKSAESEIRNLLAEKEMILKEVHHRIKNNMSTISGLLSLQAATIVEPSAIQALLDAESRVNSMGLLYDNLYLGTHFQEISAAAYLDPLIDDIVGNFPNASMVVVEKHLEDFVLSVKAIQPLGIIVNELLTNIMKYAFIGRTEGRIVFSTGLENGKAVVAIADDGNSMPESVDFGHSTGFGLILVDALTKQLGGSIRIERSNGTKITLEINMEKLGKPA